MTVWGPGETDTARHGCSTTKQANKYPYSPLQGPRRYLSAARTALGHGCRRRREARGREGEGGRGMGVGGEGIN